MAPLSLSEACKESKVPWITVLRSLEHRADRRGVISPSCGERPQVSWERREASRLMGDGASNGRNITLGVRGLTLYSHFCQ